MTNFSQLCMGTLWSARGMPEEHFSLRKTQYLVTGVRRLFIRCRQDVLIIYTIPILIFSMIESPRLYVQQPPSQGFQKLWTATRNPGNSVLNSFFGLLEFASHNLYYESSQEMGFQAFYG
jgi:hypothetical protein